MGFRRGVRNYVSRDTVLANRANNWTASVTPPADERPYQVASERKGFSRQFSSGTMCDNVAPHAWSPRIYQHDVRREVDKQAGIELNVCVNDSDFQDAVLE
jgi:hypothetical protein